MYLISNFLAVCLTQAPENRRFCYYYWSIQFKNSLYRPGIAQEHARMCLVRYTEWAEEMFSFNSINDLSEAILAFEAIKATNHIFPTIVYAIV